MGELIQFPRKNPYRRWSPEEILAIKEPPDTRTLVRQERSRIATTKAIASAADRRASKRAKRKKAIADFLGTGQPLTIAMLMRLVGERTGEKVSRTTVTELLKELEAEGCACNSHQFWKTTQEFKNL